MKRFLDLAGVIALLGCSRAAPPTAPPVAHLAVATDRAVYSVARDTAAQVVLHNLGPAAVFAPMNEYVYVEQSSNGGWVDRHPWFAVDGIGIRLRLPWPPVGAGIDECKSRL